MKPTKLELLAGLFVAIGIAAIAWALIAQLVRSGVRRTLRWISCAASGAWRSLGTKLSSRGASLEVHITISPSCRPAPAAVAWKPRAVGTGCQLRTCAPPAAAVLRATGARKSWLPVT
jgi:hypothetical protein